MKNDNVLVALIEKMHRTEPSIVYSPMQPSDIFVGDASDTTLKLAALMLKMRCEFEVAKTNLKFETDPVARANLMDDMFDLSLEAETVAGLFQLQLRSEAAQTNARLTIRDGGKIVITKAHRAQSDHILNKSDLAAREVIEGMASGDPPNRHVRVSDLLAQILGGNVDIFEAGDHENRDEFATT